MSIGLIGADRDIGGTPRGPALIAPMARERHTILSMVEGRMPLVIEGTTYYTTAEAAQRLGLAHSTVREAVRQGTITVTRFEGLRPNFIAEAEVDRYGQEHKDQQGWAARKQPSYTPDEKRRAYQRAYYERQKRARGRGGDAGDAAAGPGPADGQGEQGDA